MINPGLEIGTEAKVNGDLTITSVSEFDIPTGSVAGAVRYEEPSDAADDEAATEAEPEVERGPAVRWLIQYVKELVSLLLVGLLLLWVAPRVLDRGVGMLSERPLPNLGCGVAAVAISVFAIIVLPIIVIVLAGFFGLIQLSPLVKPIVAIAMLLMAVFTAGLYALTWLARVLVALWIGDWLGARAPQADLKRWAVLLIGAIVFVVLVTLPLLGFLIKLVLVLLGLGPVVVGLWQWLRGGGTQTDTAAA